MKYDNIFWFHSDETNEGAIYDGRIRTKMPHGFAVKTVWQGKCTESELMEKVNEYEKISSESVRSRDRAELN